MGSMFSRFCNQQNNCDYCEDNNKENNLKIDSNNDKVINNKNLNIDQNIESNYTSKVNQLSTVLNRKPSMDVTRHNFIETISQLEEVLKECQFISIDCELSGLRREWKSLSLMDTTNDRYFKLKQSIIGYQTIQFGLTAFKPIGDNESQYTCNSYNFYIFPQKSSTIPKANGDRTFSVQSSSLTFLVNNGFDFNKLIRDGISYLNREEEQICVEAINAQNELKANKSNTAINSAVTDEDKKFVNEILEKINSFITNDSLQNIDLSPCNGFKRKLIYETLKAQEFIDSIDIKTIPVSQNSFDRYIAVNKINKEEKERKQSEMLTEAIGFSKVVQLIIKYGKPVVGHNVLLDIMHTFNQFIEPLPDHYFEFKQSINALFPVLYDTKYISSTQVFKELLENTGSFYYTFF
jgi:poly(A)-specific ribonuclease